MSSINTQADERTRDGAVDEAQLRRLRELGRQAELVMANPAYQHAWDQLRSSIFKAWSETGVRDTQGMQLLHSQIRMLDGLRDLLHQQMVGGKDAGHRLAERAQRLADQERGENFLQRRMRAVRQK